MDKASAPYGYLVDSHCHLNYGGLIDDLDAVLMRAKDANVGCMLAINTKLSEFEDVLHIANSHDNIFASVGVHPHEAEKEPDVAVEALLKRAENKKVVAIGETGLDYYYDTAPREMQQANFVAHMDAARISQLPIIVHTRDADDDCINLLRSGMEKGAFPGVIHCFTATEALAQAALDMGFYISISGIVTFKNAKDLQAIVKELPLDRLLIETDAPYLAPVPHRGRTCEPAYVADTARYIADLKEIDFNLLLEETTSNFFNLFNKITPPNGVFP